MDGGGNSAACAAVAHDSLQRDIAAWPGSLFHLLIECLGQQDGFTGRLQGFAARVKCLVFIK